MKEMPFNVLYDYSQNLSSIHMKIKDTSHMCKLWGAGGGADTAAASQQMRMLRPQQRSIPHNSR